MMNRHPKYRQFWKSLAEDPEIQQHFLPLTDSDEDFHWFRWGRGPAPFGVSFHQPGRMITNLCLYCKGNRERTKRLFDALKRDSSQVESEFKEQFDEEFERAFGGLPALEWDRRDDNEESWISVYREGISIMDDPAKLEATKKWAIKTLMALKNVFGDRVDRIL